MSEFESPTQSEAPPVAGSGGAGAWVPSREPVGEKSRVEIEEADAPAINWLYSGPGVVPPDPRLKVWRQNVATGAIEETVLEPGTRDDRTTFFHVSRKRLAGGGERLQSKDFPHAPTKEQEQPWQDPDAPPPEPQKVA
jgi:hypothetical protein